MMNGRYILVWLLCLCGVPGLAQPYAIRILQWRDAYTHDLLAEPRHPVQQGDERFLDYFEPDSTYRVTATLVRTAGAEPFMVQTHSGKTKPFREYGILHFTVHDTDMELHAYQLLDLVNNAVHQEELFVPFNDPTNYELTFGGGRYIDLNTNDLHQGKIELDFNKCYNPYCAFAEGFSCPIPPDPNHLPMEIRAGEKLFRKFLGR
jgi:uncharacterized protein (DUF1684 family)